MALATMSAEVVVINLLSEHKIGCFFQSLVTRDHVTRPKPDPESLCAAANKLGEDSSRCVCIGDSIHDVEAAEAAGIPFILVDSRLFVRRERDREKLDRLKKTQAIRYTVVPDSLLSIHTHLSTM